LVIFVSVVTKPVSQLPSVTTIIKNKQHFTNKNNIHLHRGAAKKIKNKFKSSILPQSFLTKQQSTSVSENLSKLKGPFTNIINHQVHQTPFTSKYQPSPVPAVKPISSKTNAELILSPVAVTSSKTFQQITAKKSANDGSTTIPTPLKPNSTKVYVKLFATPVKPTCSTAMQHMPNNSTPYTIPVKNNLSIANFNTPSYNATTPQAPLSPELQSNTTFDQLEESGITEK
jgi:hypothetical protein